MVITLMGRKEMDTMIRKALRRQQVGDMLRRLGVRLCIACKGYGCLTVHDTCATCNGSGWELAR